MEKKKFHEQGNGDKNDAKHKGQPLNALAKKFLKMKGK